jgi:LAS superfamily LD-carboxypeptidase LdcB
MFGSLQLTGRARDHVIDLDAPAAVVHRDTVPALRALYAAARAAGFEPVVASGFRDFARQVSIWNRKWRGELPLLDADGAPLDRHALTDGECVDRILDWSALPGASRHHWGSEVDLYDAAVLPAGVVPRLVPGEYAPGGPFHAFSDWLEAHAVDFGFWRPYRRDRGGVRPEPWHWSHAAVAGPALDAMTPALIGDALRAAAIDGVEHVLPRLDALFERFVLAVDDAPVQAAHAA